MKRKSNDREFNQYQDFLDLVTNYPNFLNSSLTITDLKKNYTQIKNWLDTDDAKNLPSSDWASVSRWAEGPISPRSMDLDSFDGMNISNSEVYYRRDSDFIESEDEEMD